MTAPLLLGHSDLGWHIAAGDLIRHNGRIPLHDPWSFTAGQTEWFNLSWLWDVSQSFLLQEAGFNSIILETIALGGLIAAGLFIICAHAGATPIATCISVVLCCVLYPTFAAPLIFLGATPGVVTLLCCVIFLGACMQPKFLLLTPVTMLIWVNMHGGFIIGPCIIGLFACVALLRHDWYCFRRYVIFLTLTIAATLINPLHIFVYRGLLGTLAHFAPDSITEWQPYFRIVAFPVSLTFCLYTLLFVACELGDPKGGPIEARLLSWIFLLAGLFKLRYLTIFFVFAAVPVALHLTNLFPRFARKPVDNKLLGIIGVSVLACLPVLYWRSVPANVGLLPFVSPEQEVDYLVEHMPHARLLNHWNYGGFIIFKTRGAIPVFIDGRSATAYPDDVLRDFLPLTNPPVDPANWERVLRKYRIDTILWPKSHIALEKFLTGQQSWTLAYSGPLANIYVKAENH